MKNNLPILEFNPKLPKLSKNEKAVLKLLVEAGKLIAPVYMEQEKEIVKGAKKDIPNHIKYAKLLGSVAKKLNQAVDLTENKEFGRGLKLQAKALLDGSYEEATAYWLKIKPYILDISIGPVEHLDDKLFFGRASYQAWVGTLDVEGTDRFNNYKTITLSARRKALLPKERIDNHDKIKAKVIDVVLFSGLMARTKFVGVNLPVDVEFVEKYGSEITLFNQPNDLRIKEQILPTFNKIFSREFREGFSQEDLRRGNLRYIAMHELAHSCLYYRNASSNLQDLFQCIYELAATIVGLRMAGYLLLKDRITNKQLESMIIAFLCRSFYLITNADKSMANYTLGGTIFVNFMLESGALKRAEGLAIPNFMKIFVALHDLSYMLERLLSSGTRKNAEAFIKKYGK